MIETFSIKELRPESEKALEYGLVLKYKILVLTCKQKQAVI